MTFSFDIICHFISQTPPDLSLQTFFHSFSVPRQEDIRNPHSSRSSHLITSSQFIWLKIQSSICRGTGCSVLLPGKNPSHLFITKNISEWIQILNRNFYASRRNALYALYASYTSALLVTSHGECMLSTATPLSITSIP